MLNSTIKEQIISRRDNICKILEKEWLISEICMAVDMIINCIRNGNKVLIAGNGGSAADAQHFAAELVGRFKLERNGYSAVALTTDTSILTAIANDYGYDKVFSRQIEALGKQGDIFIGISTSGNSKNIILACEEARKKDMKIIGMFGFNGKLTEYCDCGISIPSDKTPLIQEAHEMIYHIICEEVERNLSK